MSEIRCDNKRSSKRKYLWLILILPLTFALYLFSNQEILWSWKISLNEMEIRYDTFTVSFDDAIEADLRDLIIEELDPIENNGKKRFEFVSSQGDLQIGLVEDNPIFNDFLIPVGHFYWLENSISTQQLEDIDVVAQEGRGNFLYEILKKYLDIEANIIEVEDMLTYLEENEGDSVGFLEMHNIDHNYQVLYFNDKYFFDDVEGAIEYKIGVFTEQDLEFLKNVVEINIEDVFYQTVDREEILKINMSGVTALSRNLAFKIEASGNYAYPAELIDVFLGDADIVHTSNEVSFVPGCKPERSMRFCSHPNYIQTLEAINANVIELTGNHNNDFGAQYNTETIEMYKEREWGYYGGGLNIEDASEILYKDVKGSKVAFIGYNYYDTIYKNHLNLAGENRAGANPFSFEKMEADISQAKQEEALVIVTFQFQECWSYPSADIIYPPCYKPLESPDQKEVFRRAVDYGADIVIGSQAHQPQTYEIYEGKPIFYGTGNIFFDQIQWIGTRQGMVLTHYVYDNRLLQSRITTTLYDGEMQPYVTTGEDRDLLLRLLREARD